MMLTMAWAAMSAHAITVTDTIFNRYAHEDFAFGADVSFVPMMESWGTKWLDKNGKQKDILQILKEQGINNIRLRVWTVTALPEAIFTRIPMPTRRLTLKWRSLATMFCN